LTRRDPSLVNRPNSTAVRRTLDVQKPNAAWRMGDGSCRSVDSFVMILFSAQCEESYRLGRGSQRCNPSTAGGKRLHCRRAKLRGRGERARKRSPDLFGILIWAINNSAVSGLW